MIHPLQTPGVGLNFKGTGSEISKSGSLFSVFTNPFQNHTLNVALSYLSVLSGLLFFPFGLSASTGLFQISDCTGQLMEEINISSVFTQHVIRPARVWVLQQSLKDDNLLPSMWLRDLNLLLRESGKYQSTHLKMNSVKIRQIRSGKVQGLCCY